MHTNFEVRIDRVRLRSNGRNLPVMQDKYIARAGGGAYMAVAPTEETAIREVLRTMRQHYRRGDGSMTGRIRKAIETPCERIPGASNDIRFYPVTMLNS